MKIPRWPLVLLVLIATACQPQDTRPQPGPSLPNRWPPATTGVTAPGPSSPAAPAAPPAPQEPARRAPAPIIRNAGDICPNLGDTAVDPTGKELVCDHSHSQQYNRWRFQ